MSRTKTAPVKKEVYAINRCRSVINMFLRGRIQTGYTLFPGVLTCIPKSDWKELMLNRASKSLVDQGKIMVTDSSSPNILPEYLNEKVSEPKLPSYLKGVEKKIGSLSLVTPAEIKSSNDIKIEEQPLSI